MKMKQKIIIGVLIVAIIFLWGTILKNPSYVHKVDICKGLMPTHPENYDYDCDCDDENHCICRSQVYNETCLCDNRKFCICD